MNTKELARQLVQTCLKKGADQAEAYLESVRDLSLAVRNGDIETVEESSTSGVGLRVFVQGRMAFASSNDFEPKALEDAASRAVEFARRTTADPSNVLPAEAGETAVEGLYDPEIARVPMERKVGLIRGAEAAALKVAGVSRSGGARYGEQESEIVIASSRGWVKAYQSSACGFGLSVVAEKGDQKSSGGESCNRRAFADLKSPEDIAAKAAREAVGMLDPRMVKTRKAAVVFDPDAAGALLGGILAAANGERVLQGASFLGGRLGQKIGSDLLTLIDDGTRPKGQSSAPFDGEGVPTEKRTIVEKGVLKAFFYNTIVARRAGVKSTGNASRGGFTELPGIGAHYFHLAAGTAKPEDIIKATSAGLWLKEVTGYGINPVNGQFSGGASGFWIENGRVIHPVKGLTIAGTAEEMLNGLDMVADDLDLAGGRSAPTFRIKLLQIGGE